MRKGIRDEPPSSLILHHKVHNIDDADFFHLLSHGCAQLFLCVLKKPLWAFLLSFLAHRFVTQWFLSFVRPVSYEVRPYHNRININLYQNKSLQTHFFNSIWGCLTHPRQCKGPNTEFWIPAEVRGLNIGYTALMLFCASLSLECFKSLQLYSHL